MELEDKETSADGMQHPSVSLPEQPSCTDEEHSSLDIPLQRRVFVIKKRSHIPNAKNTRNFKMKKPMPKDKNRKHYYPINICTATEGKMLNEKHFRYKHFSLNL